MNGFLVICVCTLDDVPVRMYATRAAAIKSLARTRRPRRNPLGTWDYSRFVCYKILEFRNGRAHGMAEAFDSKGRPDDRQRHSNVLHSLNQS